MQLTFRYCLLELGATVRYNGIENMITADDKTIIKDESKHVDMNISLSCLIERPDHPIFRLSDPKGPYTRRRHVHR